MHILLKNNYIMKTLKYYEIYVFIWAICGSLTLDEYYIFIIFIRKYLLYIEFVFIFNKIYRFSFK